MEIRIGKFLIPAILLIAGFGTVNAKNAALWQQVRQADAPQNQQVLHPQHFLVYTTDEATLRLQLYTLSTDPADAMMIALPMPDGTMREFKVWQTPMLPAELAAQHPDTRTFTGVAADDGRVTAKLDFTLYGFHAMIYDAANTALIDPYDNLHSGYYMAHYARDEQRAGQERMKCEVHSAEENSPAGEPMELAGQGLPPLAMAKVVNGYQLRTYRLAVGCSHQYARAATGLANPTVAQAFAKITTTMNRVNGVYERELSITMAFVPNETSIIYVTAAGDPYDANNDSAPGLLLDNQTNCDAVIGNASYDIGHVFSTGAGGLSLVGVVCQGGLKAQSVTGSAFPVGDGYDIDYVAHEMGHEFGAEHTFNSSAGSCAGNAVAKNAYEPGSGSTIMAYAGICGGDNLQPHSDAYFHAASLLHIQNYTVNGLGNTCPAKTETGNQLVGIALFNKTYSIPYLTPFELTAPVAVDSLADSVVLYGWEEWDLGATGTSFAAAHALGPIFRSYPPKTSNIRIFPKDTMVVKGVLSNAGINNAQGEKVPDVARTLKFRCTYRNIRNGKGCFTFPDDSVMLDVVATGSGSGFKVTSQPNAGTSYSGGSTQTVTWTVLNTSAPPINTTHVNIYMSVTGGYGWQYLLGTFPNNGSATVIVPNPSANSSKVRFKVKAAGNVYFNINSSDVTVNYDASVPITPPNIDSPTAVGAVINIFPVPASNVLHIATDSTYKAVIYNVVGQKVWEGDIIGTTNITTDLWARGSYYMVFIDNKGRRNVKKLVIQ
ncbi:MAG: M12 family metallo-peptidase [Bacteroidota bacterium]